MALILSQIALLVFHTKSITIRTRFSIPTTALDLLAAVTIVPLFHLKRYRSVKPSTVVSLYLAFSAGQDTFTEKSMECPSMVNLIACFTSLMLFWIFVSPATTSSV